MMKMIHMKIVYTVVVCTLKNENFAIEIFADEN